MGLIKPFASFALLFLFIFLIISPNKSLAWTCINSLEPKELFKIHDSVFIGKVIESSSEYVGTLNPKSRVTFEVKSTIKGSLGDKVTIVTTAGSVFLEGNEYLVYAYKTTKKKYLYKYEKGELATDTLCGGTKELLGANDDLKQIAELKKTNKTLINIIIPLVCSIVIIALFITLKRRRNGQLS